MRPEHAEREIIPYLRGELTAPDRERIDAHLKICADCRREAETSRQLLENLERSVPAPPEIHWGRYRAELRAKVEQRTGRARGARRWWLRPGPVALSAALAGVVLLLTVQGGFHHETVKTDLIAFEELVLGRRLDLLRRYEVVERLDLLEDFDVIQHLDGLSPTREG